MKQNVQVFLPSPKRGSKQTGLGGTEAKMEQLHNGIFTAGMAGGNSTDLNYMSLSLWLTNSVMLCCLATELCPALGDPRDCSTPGSSVLHYLPEFAQTHVHWVCDANHPILCLYKNVKIYISLSTSLSTPPPWTFRLLPCLGYCTQCCNECMDSFRSWFSPDTGPGVGLPDHG